MTDVKVGRVWRRKTTGYRWLIDEVHVSEYGTVAHARSLTNRSGVWIMSRSWDRFECEEESND